MMIEIKNVSKKFSTAGNEVVALNNINLDIKDRGMVFILGKSGSGKSTLINLIAAYDKVTSGEITIDSYSVSNADNNSYYFVNGCAVVSQDIKLIDHFTVRQNLEIVCKVAHKTYDIIPDILSSVGLDEYSENRIYELSGGECQRVAIALALVKDVKLILADEPTGNLDKKNSALVFDLLQSLSKNRLVLVVSHDSESARIYADRIITLKDGEISCDIGNIPLADTLKGHNSIIEKSIDNYSVNKNTAVKSENSVGFAAINARGQGQSKLAFKQNFAIALSMYRKRPMRYVFTLMFIIIALTIAITALGSIISTNPINVYNKITEDGYDRYVYFEAGFMSRDDSSKKLVGLLSSGRQEYDVIVDKLSTDSINKRLVAGDKNIYDLSDNTAYLVNADNEMHLTYLFGGNAVYDRQVVISEYTARIIMRYGLISGGDIKRFDSMEMLIGEKIQFSQVGDECEIVGVFASFNSGFSDIFSIADENKFIDKIEELQVLGNSIRIDNRLNNTFIVKDNSVAHFAIGKELSREIYVARITDDNVKSIIFKYNKEYLLKIKDSNISMSPLFANMSFDAERAFHTANKTYNMYNIIFAIMAAIMLFLSVIILVYLFNMLSADNRQMFDVLFKWGISARMIAELKLSNAAAVVVLAVATALVLGVCGMLGTGAYLGYLGGIGCNLIF